MGHQHHAFKVCVTGADVSEFVTWGADIADAAERAAKSLSRGWPDALISSLKHIGTALVAEAPKPLAPRKPPEKHPTEPAKPRVDGERLTRVAQLLALLKMTGGKAHLEDIARHLGITPANAQNVVRAAIGRGVVERVGRRTGIVRRVEEAQSRDTPAPRIFKPLEGIRLRVWRSLSLLDEARTAAQLAKMLGCRPREAGNALALLVHEGRVKADSSMSPNTYELNGG